MIVQQRAGDRANRSHQQTITLKNQLQIHIQIVHHAGQIRTAMLNFINARHRPAQGLARSKAADEHPGSEPANGKRKGKEGVQSYHLAKGV